jgi:AbrB family looped-hinge helix DNA binding protein
MSVVSGSTRMSSRGQIVIPKVLREAAGLMEGDEITVLLDGQKLVLYSCRQDADMVQETRAGYAAADPAARELGDRRRPSKVWADRVRALAGIERLRPEFAGLDFEDLRSESRRELEGGESRE